MKLLDNENIPIASVKILADAGFDIITVGQEFAGILDREVIDLSIRENRTILTFDRDYGELIFKKGYKPRPGVIYLRWDEFEPEEPGEYLKNLLLLNEFRFEQKLTVISREHIRQRKY
jgi:predicted nuclease of predicted toxin-antitoxin system